MSGPTAIVFLAEPERWLKISDNIVTERGKGFPAVEEGTRVVGVVPASDVVVHQIVLPDLTDAQARGAARLTVAENTVAPIETLHVAISADVDGERTIVALDVVHMARYLAAFTSRGIDPDAIIAAPLILHRPETGFVAADLGDESVIRGRDGAFLDDPVLTPLLTGGEIVTLDTAATEAALIAAAAKPEVDLRQGMFARRRRWSVDAGHFRRILWLASACLASLLVLPTVEIVHLNAAARRMEAHNVIVAQSALPRGTVVTDPLDQLEERLAAVGGGGGGFLPLANAVASAASATTNVEIGAMTFDGAGGLHVSAHATALADLTTFEAKMVGGGLIVIAAPDAATGGQPTREFTVRAR